ncbi:MAG TPA: YicC/YloC family endoribonuclease [Planctomycetota bacterium]
MTGFGSASQRDRRFEVDVEARSVNHRFLVLKQSLPDEFARHEGELERVVRDRLGRGSVTVRVSVKAAAAEGPSLPDVKLLKETAKRLRDVQKAVGIKGDLSLEDLLGVPSLWSNANGKLPADELLPRVKKALEKALDALEATRAREGTSIAADFEGRLRAIEACLDKVIARGPAVLESYQRKLDARVQALLAQKGLEVAKPDLAKEIAVYADRCDISEECQRLKAHTAEFRKIIAGKGEVGRRLDFLTQEMGREANTIASKGNDADISACAVEIKAELEKIKEQVENVE